MRSVVVNEVIAASSGTAPMIHDEKVMQLLAYRMQGVSALDWALDLRTQWDKAPSMAVYLNGELTVEGSLNALTNPIMEVGVMHCRALIGFLGMCDRKGSLNQIERRQSGDIGIEDFPHAGGFLKMVDPKIALSRYPGGVAEGEKALLTVIHIANKGLAHITKDLKDDPDHVRLTKIASTGVIALMTSYFYTPLGLDPPETRIDVRPRPLARDKLDPVKD